MYGKMPGFFLSINVESAENKIVRKIGTSIFLEAGLGYF